MDTLLFLGFLKGWEWLILLVLLILLFGRKLPGIARSLGQSIIEFKKGVKGVQDDVERNSNAPAQPASNPPVRIEAQSQPQAPAPTPAAPQPEKAST